MEKKIFDSPVYPFQDETGVIIKAVIEMYKIPGRDPLKLFTTMPLNMNTTSGMFF
jgi:hypothetical protein